MLSETWDKYRLDKMLEGFSPLTLKSYKCQYQLLYDYLGDGEVGTITTDQLKAYLVASGSHLKPSSMGHKVRCVRSLFKWLYDEGVIHNNPATKLKEPKDCKRVPKFLSETEIEYLREGYHSSLEKALFEFFYSTGCRIGEVVKLNRDDINFHTNTVVVHGKGNKEREVYFNIRGSLYLKRYLDEREDQEQCLFITERRPKKRMGTDTIRHIIKRISVRSVINKSIHPHQLRHSYATHMINNGAPIDVIQSLLGHEKSETTKVYAQLSGKLRKDLYIKYF